MSVLSLNSSLWCFPSAALICSLECLPAAGRTTQAPYWHGILIEVNANNEHGWGCLGTSTSTAMLAPCLQTDGLPEETAAVSNAYLELGPCLASTLCLLCRELP
jgi:hypothetical protein